MFGERVRGVRRLRFGRRCAGKEGSGYEHEYSEFNHNPNPSVSNNNVDPDDQHSVRPTENRSREVSARGCIRSPIGSV
jgi:hypothetical protein